MAQWWAFLLVLCLFGTHASVAAPLSESCESTDDVCMLVDSQTDNAQAWRAPSSQLNNPIPDLYDTSRFVRAASSIAPNPIPSCCPATSVPSHDQALQSEALVDSPGCPLGRKLEGSSQTGHWGYWYDQLEPALVITNDSVIDVEMPTFEAGSAWSMMGSGDAGMEDIWHWDEVGPRIAFKGPTGNAGGHYLTGPIYVCGAEPGDVLEVEILNLEPRLNPQGEAYGLTTAGNIGWWNRVGYTTPGYLPSRNSAVLYKAGFDAETGKAAWWEPQYVFDKSSPLINRTIKGCVPASGDMPRTTPGGKAKYVNHDYTFNSAEVPCIDNQQHWPHRAYAGQKYDAPEEIRDYSIQGKYRIPMNMHVGNMGLAPAVGAAVITGPPMRTGGNIDDRRIGIGARMYYPVEVAGGLLSMGDGHGAQSDGETAATGVEVSLNGKFRIRLHKADNLPSKLQLLDYPLLENKNEFVLHGYAYQDWLREIRDPQVNVHKGPPVGSVDLNRAMSTIYNQTRAFLMHNYAITEDVAVNIMSLGVDFGITQVVDSNVGLHSIIPKWLFDTAKRQEQPYYQAEVIGRTSRTQHPYNLT